MSWRKERPLLLSISVAVAAAALLDVFAPPELFVPVLGPLSGPPIRLLAVVCAAAVAVPALACLSRWRFPEAPPTTAVEGLIVASLIATSLAAVTIGVDWSSRLPVQNASWPWSIAFYLAIAFVAEVVFHVLPLTLLLALAGLVVPRRSSAAAWSGIAAVSLIEPTFQLTAAAAQTTHWLSAFVFAQVWAVNIAQLAMFRKYGFVAMFALRLIYYAWWHVVWGYWRLQG